MKKTLQFLINAFVTFAILLGICHYLFMPDHSYIKLLTDNWTITYNDVVYENITPKDMRDLFGQKTKKNDIITFTRDLDISEYTQFPTLLFTTNYSAWEIFLDDIFFTSAFMDKYESGEFIGSQYSFVTLPDTHKQTKLTIKLYVAEDNAYRFFEPPVIGNFYDVKSGFVFNNLFPLGTGIFLVIFGLAFLIITIIFYKTLPDILSQMFSSLLFIDLGIWFLSFFKLLNMFVNLWGHLSEIEFISLYLMVPLFYMIIGCIQKHYNDWIFIVVASTCSMICIFLIVLHYMDIAHLNRTLIYYQFILLICYIFLGVTISKDIMAHNLLPQEKIQLVGLAGLALTFIVNFFAYTLEFTGLANRTALSKRLLPFGALVFVFCNLINYFIYISESYARRKEYASLTHLAYADGLTDLPNRSRYEKYLADLDSSKENYCIVSLDLNGLKEINDKDGHAAGDSYLKDFATVLQQCFGDKAFLARIGGDEFVAVLRENYAQDVDSILIRLKDALEVKNVLYPVYRRSVATGYAFRSEVPEGNSRSVYLLADKRMYENKKIMHAKLGISARI